MKKRFMLIALYEDGSMRCFCVANTVARIVDLYECNQKFYWIVDGAEFYVVDRDFTVTDRRLLKRAEEIAETLPYTENHTVPYHIWYELTHTGVGNYK